MRNFLLLMAIVLGLALFAGQAYAAEVECMGTVKSVDFDKNEISFLPDCATEPITLVLDTGKTHVLMEGDMIFVTFEKKEKVYVATRLRKLRHGYNPANPPECCLGK